MNNPTYLPKNGDVIVFENTKQNERQPDFSGHLIDPNGVKLRIVLWLKNGSKGQFLSGRVSEWVEKPYDNPLPTPVVSHKFAPDKEQLSKQKVNLSLTPEPESEDLPF